MHAAVRLGSSTLLSFPKDGEVNCEVRPSRPLVIHPKFDITQPSLNFSHLTKAVEAARPLDRLINQLINRSINQLINNSLQGYVEALGKFTLKKLLLVIIYLDKAKSCRLISHDPCLFKKDSQFKVSSISFAFSLQASGK